MTGSIMRKSRNTAQKKTPLRVTRYLLTPALRPTSIIVLPPTAALIPLQVLRHDQMVVDRKPRRNRPVDRVDRLRRSPHIALPLSRLNHFLEMLGPRS